MQLLWPMVWAGVGMHIFPATWPPTAPTLSWAPGARETLYRPRGITRAPLAYGQGVGPLIRRLRAQVPQGVGIVALDVPAREPLPDDAYITLARIAASFA